MKTDKAKKRKVHPNNGLFYLLLVVGAFIMLGAIPLDGFDVIQAQWSNDGVTTRVCPK